MARAKVFISYSHDDEAWKRRLLQHLSPLVRGGHIEPWDVASIPPGDDFRERIEEAISGAKVGVFLVSPAFLASDFVHEHELPLILEKHKTCGMVLVPVLLRACAVEQLPWLSPKQRLPRDGRAIALRDEGEQDAALADVAREIAKLLQTDGSGHGAVAASSRTSTAPEVDIWRLPGTSGELFGRESELVRLDAAWANPKTNVMTVVAWGGVGKTALVNHWLGRMKDEQYRGAERVLGWSFDSQGARPAAASAVVFIDWALTKLGDADPKQGSVWEKGERLAALIRERRTLLVLDGMEPLQGTAGADEGRVQDPSIHVLLRSLAASVWEGLCVVSTRVRVTDLEQWTASAAPEMDLGHLSEEAGTRVLLNAGVKGDEAEVREAVREYEGHSLALVLLGSYLTEVADGRIERRKEIGRLTGDARKGEHVRRVMASYDNRLGPIEKAYLRLVGLFDRPADGKAVTALLSAPAIKGLTAELMATGSHGRKQALSRLRRLRLLTEASDRDPDRLDAHPLVREYFGEVLKAETPRAWKSAHGRLYDHLQRTARSRPTTVQEMAPLYSAVVHGCKAGRAQEALDDVYDKRIQRGDESFNGRKLGAFGGELTALAGFFDPPWERLAPGVAEKDRPYVLNEAGFALRAVGRLTDAVGPIELALKLACSYRDWKSAAMVANNLSELHLAAGDVRRAIERAEEGLALARKSDDAFSLAVTRAALGNALHHAGRLGEAEQKFKEAEADERERLPDLLYLFSLGGYLFCDLLLSLGRPANVRARAIVTVQIAERNGLPLDIALDHLSLGRAAVALGDVPAAGPVLTEAIVNLRRAGTQHHLPLGLVARAEYHLANRDLPACKTDLIEAHSIATRCGMRLREADVHLGFTRLALAQSPPDHSTAHKHLTLAKHLITQYSYGRRLPEVAALEAVLDPGGSVSLSPDA